MTATARLRAALSNPPALVCYLPAGDPGADLERTVGAYAAAGVDVIEVGLPSPDPHLDGPVMAASMRRALAAGTTPASVARRLAALPEPRPALVWMGYADTDLATLPRAVAEGAVDGVLVVDPARRPGLGDELARGGVARCAFLPPQPSAHDLAAASGADGYVMVQARPGVTGADRPLLEPPTAAVAAARRVTSAPVVVGFGVHDPATAALAAASGADGVVVGSACVEAILAGGDALDRLLAGLRRALDRVAA